VAPGHPGLRSGQARASLSRHRGAMSRLRVSGVARVHRNRSADRLVRAPVHRRLGQPAAALCSDCGSTITAPSAKVNEMNRTVPIRSAGAGHPHPASSPNVSQL
jgi:hypothetical protein